MNMKFFKRREEGKLTPSKEITWSRAWEERATYLQYSQNHIDLSGKPCDRTGDCKFFCKRP